MFSEVISHVLKSKDYGITTEGMADRFVPFMLVHGRSSDSERFEGPSSLASEYLRYVEALGLDPDRLIHRTMRMAIHPRLNSGCYGLRAKIHRIKRQFTFDNLVTTLF